MAHARAQSHPQFLSTFYLLLSLVAGQVAPPGNHFNSPPAAGAEFDYSDDKSYVVGDVIHLQWTTTFPKNTLALFQQNNSTGLPIWTEPRASTTYDWTVNIDEFNLNQGNVFFFWVYAGSIFDYNDSSFTSHYFNILTDGSGTSTTAHVAPPATTSTAASAAGAPSSTGDTSISSPTTASSSATTSPHATASSTTTSSQSQGTDISNHGEPQPNKQTGGGMSDGTKIGIGVGLGVGITCLAIGALIGFLLRRRSSKQTDAQPKMPEHDQVFPYMAPAVGTGKPVHVNGVYAGELEANPAYGHYNELPAKSQTPELGT